jgi:phosphoenolpyruvate synthase/pyruvate phosphate dikinase
MNVFSREVAGGKAFELQKLKINNFNVPAFYILTQDEYLKYETNLQEWPLFQDCLKLGPLAVRSSGSLEDGSNHSFAGIFETILNISSAEELENAIHKIWKSSKTQLVQNYLKNNNIETQKNHFAILIQKYIEPDYAGIVFTADPVSGLRSRMHISFTEGAGDSLAAGIESGTTVILNERGEIIQKTGLLNLKVAELEKLRMDSYRIAKLFKMPVDVEWALLNGELYILQARPITTPLGHSNSLHQSVFDNSNIQESYCGVTTPLTFTYAVEAYTQVYNQIMKLMNMSQKQFDDAQFRHSHMLGLVNGRVYYNINSWYEGLLYLPHFGRRKDDMEKMMGLKKPVDFVCSVEISLKEKIRRFPGFIILAARLLYKFSKIKTYVGEFEKWFKELEKKYNPADNQFLENEDLCKRLYQFQKESLEKWGIPILNDFLVMMSHGSLRREMDKYGLLDNFHQCIRGAEIESLKPTLLLNDIARKIHLDSLASLVLNSDSMETLLLVLKQKHTVIFEQIENFLTAYGDRSMGELKLETVTYTQNPQNLLQLLKELVKAKGSFHSSAQENSTKFLAQYKIKAGFFKSLTINRRLEKLKFAVGARELMRLNRTKVFGMNREYYLEIGKRLFDIGQIENPRDVFYLTREEVFNFFWGKSITLRLKPLVALRKEEWAQYDRKATDDQVQLSIPNSHWMNFLETEEFKLQHQDEIKGLGCSSGEVRGFVKKVRSPNEIENLQGAIMVAERTDPGWTPLFSMIAGIIVEKGSALSHSAVIAREMRIPAVVGIENIMRILNDGDEVIVNGTTGKITLIDKEVFYEPKTFESTLTK